MEEEDRYCRRAQPQVQNQRACRNKICLSIFSHETSRLKRGALWKREINLWRYNVPVALRRYVEQKKLVAHLEKEFLLCQQCPCGSLSEFQKTM